MTSEGECAISHQAKRQKIDESVAEAAAIAASLSVSSPVGVPSLGQCLHLANPVREFASDATVPGVDPFANVPSLGQVLQKAAGTTECMAATTPVASQSVLQQAALPAPLAQALEQRRQALQAQLMTLEQNLVTPSGTSQTVPALHCAGGNGFAGGSVLADTSSAGRVHQSQSSLLQWLAGSMVNPAWARAGQYQDLIWTPTLAATRDRDLRKDEAMIRAVHTAMEVQYNGNPCSLSQLGSDFAVAQLKKDPMFKNLKMLEILKRYEDIFEVYSDPSGWLVRVQPAALSLLGHSSRPIDTTGVQLSIASAAPVVTCFGAMPERIENPLSAAEGMQALRIELLHALTRRGGKSAVQELGQEPRVQALKRNLPQAKKLLDFIKLFPGNFQIVTEAINGTTFIEVLNADVSDREVIDMYVLRIAQAQFGRSGVRTDGLGQGRCRGRGRGAVKPPNPPAWPGSESTSAVAAAQAQAQAALENLAQTMAIAGMQLPGLPS